ncbi:hypothetical protein QNM99_08205 [Pseudomonas sp. PCH446]
MIPVPNPIAEPEKFDDRCRKKGTNWLKKHPEGKRPANDWSEFRLDLARGFENRCAFGAMWISSGTIDHFVSCDEDINLAYEWGNYRYVDGWINSSKKKKEAADLLDPFHVAEGWFEILLPSLQLAITNAIPDEFRELAEKTLRDLPIRDDERLVRNRREWLRMYEEKELTLEGLRKKAPLVAAAVQKKQAIEAARKDVDL